MKVAIIHHWLVAYRGGEKVLEELCVLFPEADIYTHVLDRFILPTSLASKNIRTTFVNSLPLAKKLYQYYLPLMPLALENLDLRGYDLVISIESGPAKGILTLPHTMHICYCNTPMRYLWDMYQDYMSQSGWIKKILIAPFLHYLRIWDGISADRVDFFIANSGNVALRVAKHYRRDADVIFPPVSCESFYISEKCEDFYLVVGQLVSYKRADLAVKAFTRMGRRLVVIGEGEQLRFLREIGGNNVEFLGRRPFEVLRSYYSRCKALVFPGEEDFGIVPVEAMASGRPVIAYGRGGVLETVVDGRTGVFFDTQTEDALIEAVSRFEKTEGGFNPEAIREHALQFGADRFRMEVSRLVDEKFEEFHRLIRNRLSFTIQGEACRENPS